MLVVASVVLGSVVAVSGTAAAAGPAGMAGSGTAADPYVITTVEQLQAMEQDLDAYYLLGTDIDATGYAFVPIGEFSPNTEEFNGTLDGQGHAISGLSIDENNNEVGLFRSVGADGTVTNVGLEAVDVRGESHVGGLVGINEGTVRNSYVTGAVSGEEDPGFGFNVGGLVGLNQGVVAESYATADATGDFVAVGGLVGHNSGTVSESYAAGDASGVNSVGGLIGQNFGTVTESYAVGGVSGQFRVGGLVGDNDVFDEGDGTVDASYWDTLTTGRSSSDGGGTGLTTSEMTGPAVKANVTGFDFGTTWAATDGYPVLQWQLPAVEVDAVLSPRNPGTGETATVTATVSNPTDAPGGVELAFAVDGVDLASELVGVGAGATVETTFDHTFAEPGEHTVSLTSTDGDATERIAWTVVVNTPPNATFGHSPAEPNTNETVTFDATGSSDPDGTVVAFEWDHDGDGQYDDATGAVSTTSYATSGEKTVSVRVTDDGGASDTATRTIRVNAPPTAVLSAPASAVEGASVALDASGSSDPDDGALTYAWDLDGDGDFDDESGVSASTSFVDDGDYEVGMRVTDVDGASDTDSAIVTVTNAPPTVTSEVDDSANEGDLVSASGSFTDSGAADTHAVSIDWGDGTVESVDVTQEAGSGSFAADHVYADDGAYAVAVTVTDDDGGSDASTEGVTISNVAPSVSMTLDDAGVEDDPVSLSATFADPGAADTHTASVDWGDGTSESVAVTRGAGTGSLSTTHTYATGGVYPVELTVTDDDDGATTVADSITVSHVVDVDVKPGNGDETDPINTKSRGVVPVAIYSADGFDASSVDVASLRFGAPDALDAGDGAKAAHDGHLEDVDGDGDLDLVVHFTGETGLASGDAAVEVVGASTDGVPLVGEDAVRTVGGNGGGNGKGNGNGNARGNGGGGR